MFFLKSCLSLVGFSNVFYPVDFVRIHTPSFLLSDEILELYAMLVDFWPVWFLSYILNAVPYFIVIFILTVCLGYIYSFTNWFSLPFVLYFVSLTTSLLFIYFSKDFIGLFLGFVALNLCLYGLMIRGYTFATDTAVRYFLLGSVAMCFFFFGVSLQFCLSGSFSFSTFTHLCSLMLSENPTPGLLFSQKLAYLCMLCLFLFKLGVFPFHFYVPSIYTSISYGVLGVYSLPVKLVLFFSFINFLELLGTNVCVVYPLLLFVGVGSLFVGTLGALRQVRLRSFWAYSYISSMGFVFIGFTVSSNTLITSAASSYFLQYLITWAFLFWFFGVIGQTNPTPDATKSFGVLPLTYISDLSVVGSSANRRPLYFVCLLLSSLAGLPPTVGFFFKFGVLSTLSSNFLGAMVLPSVLLLLPLGAFNYLRLMSASISGMTCPTHLTLRSLVTPEDFEAVFRLCFYIILAYVLPHIFAPVFIVWITGRAVFLVMYHLSAIAFVIMTQIILYHHYNREQHDQFFSPTK